MAGQSSAMFGWSWTEASVLGSQVFGRALMESCGGYGTGTTYISTYIQTYRRMLRLLD